MDDEKGRHTLSTSRDEQSQRKPAQQDVRFDDEEEESSPANDAPDEQKPPAQEMDQQQHDQESSSAAEEQSKQPRQIIAVSSSRGPAAFFNLARKFLATDEMCDLSALEGAIASAVDAANLLERSQLATIVQVQTSYVEVEPKRKKQPEPASSQSSELKPAVPAPLQAHTSTQAYARAPEPAVESTTGDAIPPNAGQQAGSASGKSGGGSKESCSSSSRRGRDLRRARIVITVKRTEEYKQWLEENAPQDLSTGGGSNKKDEDEGEPGVQQET